MEFTKRQEEDLKILFVLTILGGALIFLSGLSALLTSSTSSAYPISFPFVSASESYTLLSLGGLVSGLVIIIGTLIVILSSAAMELLKRYPIVVSLTAIILDTIGLPSGGGFLIGFSIILVCSFWLVALTWPEKTIKHHTHQVKEAAVVPVPAIEAKDLSGDEKTMWKLLLKNNGTLLQSKLIQEMGLSKVKVTRILNRLEAKNLIERRRIGMSNLVLIKK